MDDPSVKANNGIGAALVLVFLSGFAALVYQVLWMKQIGLIFGNTSHAVSATLTSFFAGLAAGSWALGRYASTSRNPLRVYAWLEAGIAISALLYFAIIAIYRGIYPVIYQSIDSSVLLLLIKLGLSLLLVFPPAFFMGGTIPVMGQFVIRQPKAFGKTSAMMYGINTLGAAIGVALAGFFLPLWLGFHGTCGLAILTTAAIALFAFRWSRHTGTEVFKAKDDATIDPPTTTLTRQERRRIEREAKSGKAPSPVESPVPVEAAPTASRKPLMLLCFLSGFGVLALEVLWTRMFSQVLENSVYTYSTILLVVLICLAIGSLVSSLLSRLNTAPFIILSVLLILGAGAVVATPYLFMAVTDGMQIVATMGTWSSYILLILKTACLTIAPSGILLGTIFPYLMKIEERHLKSPGLSLGQLATANTIGAILGALVSGFVLLEVLGMWRSMQVIAIVYIAAALILPLKWETKGIVTKVACLGMLLVVVSLKAGNLPVVSTDPNAVEDKLVEIWEGSDCTVTVTDGHLGRAIKINSHYSLGSTGAYMQEKLQADLPLFVKPDAEDIFFLGVGTGITAGSALDPRHQHVKRVVACELVPEVVTAAKKYMTDFNGFDTTGGLFEDPRATVLVEDGRHYLMATDESFDIINADLFVPFRSGAGSLYTQEHFTSCRDHLKPGGLFVQWLPLYQLTEYEFSIISKTMLSVFDQVSLWRHNFQPGSEIVALIGHQGGVPLPSCEMDSREDKLYAVSGKTHLDIQRLNLPLDPQTIMLFYGGNLSAARELFDAYPINTDNRPVIEYMAPRSYRESAGSSSPWFTGEPFAAMVQKLQSLCPPVDDPLLVHRTEANRRLPLAGMAMQRARLAEADGDMEATQREWQTFVNEWTDQ